MSIEARLRARVASRSIRPVASPARRPLVVALAAAWIAFGATTPVFAQSVSDDDVRSTANEDGDDAEALQAVRVTAAEIARQALGTSTITADDIARRPPANDLSELLRTMPGVNLTGNSASGQYGNNRQIDLRGMGPENTLVLVDGKAIGSRNAIRMGRSGERNTRGDTNWVPAEMIERIEVLRGPAAARYGSGASGGVINIVTKRPTGEFKGSANLYMLSPQHDEEGGSERAGVQMSGPISENLSFRFYGNASKTEADALDLNAEYATGVTPPAGREGVRNKDANALVRWDLNDDHVVEFEGGMSRQGNIYAGDRAVSGGGSDLLTELANAGAETNVMLRNTASVTHRGRYGEISSRLTLSGEATNNKRLDEGLAGSSEGSINGGLWSTSRLRNTALDGELNVPTTLAGTSNIWTFGFEYADNRLEDPFSVSQTGGNGGGIGGLDPDRAGGKADAQTAAVYVEDNIYAGDDWIITPGLRADHHSQFGNNLSPSLNVQYRFADDWMVKGGVARAFKAPNLYQSNPNYLYYTMGNGCPNSFPSMGAGCYVQGNANLDPETSVNKEIGVEWAPASGHHASLTYFHNDYDNKISAGYVPIGVTIGGTGRIFEWENAPKAVVQGFEGNLVIPLLGDAGDVLKWNTNVTYMIENENKTTGQPLSVIPEYTVNTSLDWQATAKLSLLLTGTFYGEQEPAGANINNDPLTGDYLSTRGPYSIWGVSGRYRINEKLSIGAGINNLADKRLFREANSNASGAATYNEPGRAYFASLNVGF